MTTAETAPQTDTWAAQLEQLRARYKHVRPPILAALNVLIHDQNISIDDAKAQAALHGVKVTAASVNAARTLMSRMDAPVAATMPAVAATSVPAADQKRPPRRPRAPESTVDAEALIRNVIGKLQTQGNAEAERLREAIRKAVAVLQAAVGS